jgi:hypothetical protein
MATYHEQQAAIDTAGIDTCPMGSQEFCPATQTPESLVDFRDCLNPISSCDQA